MNSNVYIKSYANGLKVFLDENCKYEDIVREITAKFSESKGFFMGGKIAISFEGRKLTHEQEIELVKVMEETADMRILYIISKDEESDENFMKAVLRPVPGPIDDSSFAKFYYGDVKRHDKLECDNGLIILGDIEPGAEVVAKGSIIVLGGIYGNVSATKKTDKDKLFISCYDAGPERLTIDSVDYQSKEPSKWLIKPKMSAKVFYLEDDIVKSEQVSKDSLLKFYKKMM